MALIFTVQFLIFPFSFKIVCEYDFISTSSLFLKDRSVYGTIEPSFEYYNQLVDLVNILILLQQSYYYAIVKLG